MSITTKRAAVLLTLRELRKATRSQLGINPVMLDVLLKNDMIRPDGQTKTGKRGRPATYYKLTRKGAARARVLAA